VNNTQGHAEAYKDVVYEDVLKIGGETKAPDYSFRVGGTRKFFVEAKKPSVDLKSDPAPALQLRRYSWSAKLPLGIVTDFHEFAIYDTRIRPVEGDKASTARVFYCRFEQFPEKWDEIAAIFSKDAVLKGSFDKYAANAKGKRGTAEFDAEFLKDMEHWRALIARNLALRNAGLSERELNFAVQRILDRIIFLRIAEDRGIEPYGQLQALTAGPNIYPRLREIFERADFRYNSGLFHFTTEKGRDEAPDKLTPGLALDDIPLKEILTHLYWPKSPYAFAVIPADLLGHVYEQFLGKVIHLSDGHQAKVEEKPEVRKAGGVYYTPTYIVDYIVRQTVGPLVADKSPKQIEALRVLDPACGSGSFLLGAFDYLLAWHLDYYAKNDPEKWAKQKPARLYETAPNAFGIGKGSKNWQLTTAERKRILTAHLYGVDIDAQAVEVTKLSLLLKVLEGEARELRGQQLDFHRVLPDLGQNIKCGNSLIGSDFYAQPDLPAFDEEARYKLNAFDWAHEFKPIMDAGGFDTVIGNPPYVRIQTLQETQPEAVAYLGAHYRAAAAGNYDLYVCFLEKGLNLLDPRGRMGFIVPHKFFNAEYGESLRRVIADGRHLERVVHFGHQQVFSGATTYTAVLTLTRSANTRVFVDTVDELTAWRTTGQAGHRITESASLTSAPWNFTQADEALLRAKLEHSGKPLGQVTDIFVGLQTSADKVFVLPSAGKLEKTVLKPFLTTGDLVPYAPARANAWMIFPYALSENGADLMSADSIRKRAPNCWTHLEANAERLRNRERGKWRHDRWYAFGRSQNLTQMAVPKLIVQVTALRPTVILDEAGLHMTGGGSGPFYGIRPTIDELSLRYLLGIVNSKLFGWFVRGQSTVLRGGYIKFSKQYIESVPIILPPNRTQHDTLVTHVERMLKLHEDLAAVKSPDAQTRLQRDIAATDQLVYQLYDLTPEEIALVETATAPAAKKTAEPDNAEPVTPPATAGYTQAEVDAAHHYSVQEDPPKTP